MIEVIDLMVVNSSLFHFTRILTSEDPNPTRTSQIKDQGNKPTKYQPTTQPPPSS